MALTNAIKRKDEKNRLIFLGEEGIELYYEVDEGCAEESKEGDYHD